MTQESRNPLISPVGFQDILVLVALHSLVAMRLLGFADHPAAGRHLSTGHWVFTHHSIPKFDPFLFSHSPNPWVSQQWLSDLLLWLLYSAGGWPLLYAILTLIFSFAYFGILYRAISRISGQFLLASAAMILAFKVGEVDFFFGPQIFGLFLFAFVYALVCSMHRKLAGGENPSQAMRRMYYMLPLVFLLWANLDGMFTLGLLLVFLLACGTGLDCIASRPSTAGDRTWSATRALFVLWGCCIVATLVNPHGLAIYSEVAAQFDMQRAPLNFGQSEGVFFEISLFVFFIGLFVQPTLSARLGYFGLISVLVFAHLGMTSVAFAPYYGIVAAIPFIYSLQSLGEKMLSRFASLAWCRSALRVLEVRERSSMHGYAVLSVLLILLLIDCTANHKLLLYEGPFGPRPEVYPYAALDVVKETSITDGPIVIAAPPVWGSFITFYGEGEMRPIIDDRTAMLGANFFEENLQALKPGNDWMGYLTQRGANRLLLPREDPLAVSVKNSGDALPLYEDNLSILFELPSAR